MGKRSKLDKHYSEGSFGMADVPRQMGVKHQAWIEHKDLEHSSRDDKRSWKRRRKTRYRVR